MTNDELAKRQVALVDAIQDVESLEAQATLGILFIGEMLMEIARRFPEPEEG